jgi:hypothetical protein
LAQKLLHVLPQRWNSRVPSLTSIPSGNKSEQPINWTYCSHPSTRLPVIIFTIEMSASTQLVDRQEMYDSKFQFSCVGMSHSVVMLVVVAVTVVVALATVMASVVLAVVEVTLVVVVVVVKSLVVLDVVVVTLVVVVFVVVALTVVVLRVLVLVLVVVVVPVVLVLVVVVLVLLVVFVVGAVTVVVMLDGAGDVGAGAGEYKVVVSHSEGAQVVVGAVVAACTVIVPGGDAAASPHHWKVHCIGPNGGSIPE